MCDLFVYYTAVSSFTLVLDAINLQNLKKKIHTAVFVFILCVIGVIYF